MKQVRTDFFQITEVHWGAAKTGELLELKGFRLEVLDETAGFCCSTRIEPITSDMLILVFLKPLRYGVGGLTVAGLGNCYFWARGKDAITELRKQAAPAISLREAWLKARSAPDQLQRTKNLWPFLWSHDGAAQRSTEAELKAIGPVAGDYFADQLSTLPFRQKEMLLRTVSEYHSSKLHRALVLHLSEQQRMWGSKEHERPISFNDMSGELFRGMEGLVGFKDPVDLPFIRSMALWALHNELEEVCFATLFGFRDMPDRANLPVIAAMLKLPSEHYLGQPFVRFEIGHTLLAHRFPETVPLVAQFVREPVIKGEAQAFLKDMTGVDKGDDPEAWIAWYEANKSKLR